MILTKASATLEWMDNQTDGLAMLERIEKAGRTCYKSENNISESSAVAFVASIIKRGHESVLEHEKLTARFICDRGVTHEIVRHRLASYSQESTRYCNYKGGVEFIIPCWLPDVQEGDGTQNSGITTEGAIWLNAMIDAERAYLKLTESGWSPQQARSVLPNSLKTELVMTANLREWRYFFKMRAEGIAGKPHPQMIEVADMLLEEAKEKVPVVFDDICA